MDFVSYDVTEAKTMAIVSSDVIATIVEQSFDVIHCHSCQSPRFAQSDWLINKNVILTNKT